jgi:hypothetical protein
LNNILSNSLVQERGSLNGDEGCGDERESKLNHSYTKKKTGAKAEKAPGLKKERKIERKTTKRVGRREKN